MDACNVSLKAADGVVCMDGSWHNVSVRVGMLEIFACDVGVLKCLYFWRVRNTFGPKYGPLLEGIPYGLMVGL